MNLFGIGKSSIALEPRINQQVVEFDFFEVRGSKRQTLQTPLSNEEFRTHFKSAGFDKYIAFEELSETEFMPSNGLPVNAYYKLLHNEELFENLSPILTRLQLPIAEMPVRVKIHMTGNSAQSADFKIEMKNENDIHLQHQGIVRYPFFEVDKKLNLLPKAVWQLYQTIMDDSIQDGYEKIAKVQSIARNNNFEMDTYLNNESFEYIDSFNLEPKLLDDNTMKLEMLGATENQTKHLNVNARTTTIRNKNQRTRIRTSPEVRNDASQILKKQFLKGEEIPQFLENPQAIFPEHTFNFDLEKFSGRVKGLILIQKPIAMKRDGKRVWIDAETGVLIPIDEEELKSMIKRNPSKLFHRFGDGYITTDHKLKKNLGLVDDNEKEIKESYVLDIYDNQEKLEYGITQKSSSSFMNFPIPSSLNATLHEYQKEGFNWIASLEKSGIGGLLADDMGLGKTIQVITFLLHQRELLKLTPTLIVLPVALIENWENEIEKFANILSNQVYVHLGAGRSRDSNFLASQPITFTSYDTLKADQLIFGEVEYQCIIADEAQNVKSYGTSRSRALRAMKANFRLAMTGTPVENGLEELWSIMDFVEPGAFGSLIDFRTRFIKRENNDGLMDLLKPYYLRRTKKEVLADKLPQKHILPPAYFEASIKQRNLAKSLISSIRAKQANMLTAIMSLRQIYAHPAVVLNEHPLKEDSPKLIELLKLIDPIKRKNEKMLIFTEFRKVQSILRTEITKKYGIHVPIIDGSTKNRAQVVTTFSETPGFGVMILSPKAAGVGLTITRANHVVHYTRWWNPAVENQATDRAYRIGQEKDVYVYQLITQDKVNFPTGTVEEIMHLMLAEKSELAENVIIPFDTESFQKQVYEQLRGKVENI